MGTEAWGGSHMTIAFEKRKATSLLRLRIMRGHVLMLRSSIGHQEREKNIREILDLISELETEVALEQEPR